MNECRCMNEVLSRRQSELNDYHYLPPSTTTHNLSAVNRQSVGQSPFSAPTQEVQQTLSFCSSSCSRFVSDVSDFSKQSMYREGLGGICNEAEQVCRLMDG